MQAVEIFHKDPQYWQRTTYLPVLCTILHHGSRPPPFSVHQTAFWAGTDGRQHCWTLCPSQWRFHRMWVQCIRKLWSASELPHGASDPADEQPQPKAQDKGKQYFKHSLSYSQRLHFHKAIWYSVQVCKVAVAVAKPNAADSKESLSRTVQPELSNSIILFTSMWSSVLKGSPEDTTTCQC